MRLKTTQSLTVLFFSLVLLFPSLSSSQSLYKGINVGGGLNCNLNSRMKNDVASCGASVLFSGEFLFKQLFEHADFSLSPTLDLSVFPGGDGAYTLSFEFNSRYIRQIELFGKTFNLAIGLGPAYINAPTADSGSSWFGYDVKLDAGTFIKGNYFKIYAKFSQIFMSEVEDPLFASFGMEYRYDLFGNPINKTQKAVNLPVNKNETADKTKKHTVKSTNPDDLDGDGVPNSNDLCPHTAPEQKIDEKGCREIADGMTFKDISFPDNSTILSPAASMEILRLGEILKSHTELHVEIVLTSTDENRAKQLCKIISDELAKHISSQRIHLSCSAAQTETIRFNFRLKL